MARGKKTGGKNWVKGQTGNPNGQPRIPDEIKKARSLNKIEAERILNKFLEWPLEQLVAYVGDKANPVLEVLIARILIEAIKKGDHFRTEWLLQRLIGKVKEELEVNHTHNLNAEIVKIINDVEGGNNEGEDENDKEENIN